MKKHTFAWSIAAAVSAALPFMLQAQGVGSSGFDVAATPSVTHVVNNNQLASIANSHLNFLSRASSSTRLADSFQMNHLQLILNPGAARHAQMEAFIASQHDRNSPNYKQWLTPNQFGNAFGASDSDIAAVTAWLSSQGFSVNNVYPNKLQIDFSGTSGQISKAFHTQETVYTFGNEQHLANSSNISVPAAFKGMITGVMGLNDFHEAGSSAKAEVAQFNRAKGNFELAGNAVKADSKGIKQSINFQGSRGLVPNDMARIYNTMPLRQNGVTGAGVTIAVLENGGMQHIDWDNFVTVFNLAQYGGSLTITNPAPPSGDNNCNDPNSRNTQDFNQPLSDAEYATAIAPGANIVLAVCSNTLANFQKATTNTFGGVFIAASNLINAADGRPDIISASYSNGELIVDSASKIGVDQMWAQADAEGISVFVTSGDSGSAPNFNYAVITGIGGDNAIDTNALATSPHVTAVGGTDLADVLDGTTNKYFAHTPSAVGGSALGYVPEIPWNQSCGNGVAAKAYGFSSAVAFCKNYLIYDPNATSATGVATSGGASRVDTKPTWQNVYNVPADGARDIPDVSLFGGSFGRSTYVVTCTATYPCNTAFSGPIALYYGNSISTPMMAGIQALMDQGLAARGAPLDQGNAAPVLYALAAQEYGDNGGPGSKLAACNADNGAATSNCIFHNVTRGAISSQCMQQIAGEPNPTYYTPHCYFYGTVYLPVSQNGYKQYGLTTTDVAPTSYTTSNKAWGAQPGWSFAAGLGSMDAKNLLIAWRAFDNLSAIR